VARPRTRSGPLSELARHVVLPSGIVSTGWPAVRDKAAEFGDTFDEWQDGAGRAILAKRADGLYAATIGGVVLSIPRQVAKTFLVGRIVFVLCILFPKLTVVWTAHRTRTATRTFQSLQGYAKRRKVAPYVLHIRTANGEQEIAFRNGSVILFGAREMGFGRGFEEVDVEVFDEAQILGEKALDDMVAATNQARHPHGALLFYMGTPPRPIDSGEAFKIKRRKALAGADDMVYIEFSADRSAYPDHLDDRAQWAKANPSYPHRTPVESMLRLRDNLISDEGWMHEALGIWDDEGGDKAFGPGVWGDGLADMEQMPTVRAVGVATSWNRAWTSIGASGVDGSEKWVWSSDRGRRTGWVPRRAKEIQDRHGCKVVVAGSGPTSALIADLEREGVTVTIASAGDYMDACASLLDDATEKSLRHRPDDEELNTAVDGAQQKRVGDRFRWDRQTPGVDVEMLEAVTLAAWGADMDDDSDGGWMVAL
jgi:hypothetical protein